ncbi:MAG: hypothetical protein ACLUDU_15435 [Butyricimonas faecihominis]
MWRVVKQYRGEGGTGGVSAWRWVAADVALLLGGILWINSREKKDVLVAGVVPEINRNTSCRVAYGTRKESICPCLPATLSE